MFSDAIDEIDVLVAAEAGFGVRRILEEADPTEYERIQPVTFAYQVALARWLLAVGVRPAAVLGHSVGEVAAAHISGALVLRDAVRVVRVRSRLLARSSGGQGAMASIGLSAEDIEKRLGPVGGRLSIAVYAGPAETVVAGDTDEVDRLVAQLELAGVRCRRVAQPSRGRRTGGAACGSGERMRAEIRDPVGVHGGHRAGGPGRRACRRRLLGPQSARPSSAPPGGDRTGTPGSSHHSRDRTARTARLIEQGHLGREGNPRRSPAGNMSAQPVRTPRCTESVGMLRVSGVEVDLSAIGPFGRVFGFQAEA